MNWKKLFKQKRLEELTDTEIEKMLKENKIASYAIDGVLFLAVACFLYGALGSMQVANSFSGFERLTLVIAAAIVFMLPISLINFVISARSTSLVYVQLRAEQRLREVEKKLEGKQQ